MLSLIQMEILITTKKIEAVYFDDGICVLTNYAETNDLIKHANGAKNIYLFTFE
ncbi:hypothetical protein [Candidatus Phytoplasma sp. AldY-WA1]|uniref:hypothetical protein n=1 Tax=Candidatus Phytoplasma sp. AldY-WA1 TaxID=2852100 RepID=UPI00254AB4E9|nr:hypothetical protein [Candidatus Phytoplasma sp. AldY-WA1]